MTQMNLSDEEWKQKLTPEQYRVLRKKGTETPGTGELLYNKEKGVYTCAGCNTPIFSSDTKYESTMPGLIGWPSFSELLDNDAVELTLDKDLWMERTEVICKTCGGHLGHLFDDPSSPNGKHYCINSASLQFDTKNNDK